MAGAAESVKHVRAIHFTIVVTCLALVLSASLNENARLGRALEQLRDVKLVLGKLDKHWDTTYPEAILGRLYKSHPPQSIRRLELNVTGRPLGPVFAMDPTNLLYFPWEWHRDSCWFERSRSSMEYHHYTLSEFKRTWNALSHLSAVRRVTRLVSIAAYNAPPSSAGCEPVPIPTQVKVDGSSATVTEGDHEYKVTFEKRYLQLDWPKKEFNPDLRETIINVERVPEWRSYKNLTATNEYIFSNGEQPYSDTIFPVWLQIGVESEPIEVASPLANIMNTLHLREPVGPFGDAFHDLDVVTARFQDAPLEQVERILESVQEHAGTELQLLGVKVPSRAIRVWGILVLIGVQLYFIIHLRQLRRIPLTPNDLMEGAWIGSYAALSARAMAITSASLLPMATVLVVTFRSPSGLWILPGWESYILMAMVLGIGFVSAKMLNSLSSHISNS